MPPGTRTGGIQRGNDRPGTHDCAAAEADRQSGDTGAEPSKRTFLSRSRPVPIHPFPLEGGGNGWNGSRDLRLTCSQEQFRTGQNGSNELRVYRLATPVRVESDRMLR